MTIAPAPTSDHLSGADAGPDLNADVRDLVTLETIREIRPIDGADAIEAAVVRGWTVVVKKGEFVVGQECLYLEIDSALPMSDPRFSFLEPRGTKTLEDGTVIHRLKTARLRGVYSQGLALPAADFAAEIADWRRAAAEGETADLAAMLGVTKYEPPLPGGTDIVGEFPTQFVAKTDSERAQNLIDAWPTLLAAGPWVATEKLDGTSLTVIQDPSGSARVCMRNYEVADGNNVYWNAVHASGLLRELAPGEVVQAEIVGPGVQKNPLGLPDLTVAVFTFTRDGVTLPREQWPAWVTSRTELPRVLPVPVYDFEFPATAAQSVELVDGLKSILAPGRNAEGVVWHRANGLPLPELGYRSTLKSLSNKYLLKHDG